MLDEIGKDEITDLVEHYLYKEFNNMKREYNPFSINADVAEILDMKPISIYNKIVPSISKKNMFYDMIKDPIIYLFPSVMVATLMPSYPALIPVYVPIAFLVNWIAYNGSYNSNLMDTRKNKIYITSLYGAEGCGTLAHELAHLYHKALSKNHKGAKKVFKSDLSEGIARGVEIDVLDRYGYGESARFSSLAELLMKYAYKHYEKNSIIEKALSFCENYVKTTRLKNDKFYLKFVEYLNEIIIDGKIKEVYYAQQHAGTAHIDGWTKVAYMKSKGKKLKEIMRGDGKI